MAGNSDQVGPVAFLFETCVVGERLDGLVSIALIDGAGTARERVQVIACRREAATLMCSAINAALKQGDGDEADT